MQQCPSCNDPTAPDDQFCRACGKPLAATPHPDATVRWSGQQLPARSDVPKPGGPVQTTRQHLGSVGAEGGAENPERLLPGLAQRLTRGQVPQLSFSLG